MHIDLGKVISFKCGETLYLHRTSFTSNAAAHWGLPEQ